MTNTSCSISAARRTWSPAVTRHRARIRAGRTRFSFAGTRRWASGAAQTTIRPERTSKLMGVPPRHPRSATVGFDAIAPEASTRTSAKPADTESTSGSSAGTRNGATWGSCRSSGGISRASTIRSVNRTLSGVGMQPLGGVRVKPSRWAIGSGSFGSMDTTPPPVLTGEGVDHPSGRLTTECRATGLAANSTADSELHATSRVANCAVKRSSRSFHRMHATTAGPARQLVRTGHAEFEADTPGASDGAAA